MTRLPELPRKSAELIGETCHFNNRLRMNHFLYESRYSGPQRLAQPTVGRLRESHAGPHSPSKRAYIASQTHTTEHTAVKEQLVFRFAIILIEPCRYRLFPEKRTPFLSLALTYSLSHPVPSINLLQNLGAEGNCHADITVQHLSRIKANPNN